MFARCPQCQTVHPLSASLLAQADGLVRCGNCRRQFNALNCLFDHWPDSASPASQAGKDSRPPLLGRVESEDASPDVSTSADSHSPVEKSEPNRRLWIAVFLLLIVATAVNALWTFRQPLLENASFRATLEQMDLVEPKVFVPFRDLGKIHLVSRDMHQHPTRSGMLALSITFVNRADQAQAYPVIEVTLSDSTNTPLARRAFSPADYLLSSGPLPVSLAPDVHVPVLLEFADPGTGATGFELKFR